MNRSTTLYIAVATLVLGSGTSFFAFVQPALTEQAKLKAQKAGLEVQKTSLDVQVKDLEGKAANAAMLDIAFFDLRTSQNQRRELETKTVQTLASLTEIFNDHKIRVQELAPTGETVGLNKPVPSAAPSGGSPAPGTSPAPGAPGAAAVATPVPGTPTTPPPISLTHKAFKLKVRGEYANLVKAMNEIQGLPKAISVSQYNLQLLDKGQESRPAPTFGEQQQAPSESPTALEMGFHVSITFLMAGGSPVAAPSPGAVPVGQAPVTNLLAFAEWVFGSAAHAAEDAASVPKTPVVAVAPAAKAAVVPPTARYRLNGIVAENGGLRLVTAGGTPPYTLVGITRNKAVLELANTSLAPGATASAAPGGAIVDVRVVANKPGVVRVVVETDGSKRLLAQLDRAERLRLVPAAWNAPVGRVASAQAPAKPAVQAKPAAHGATAPGGLTRVEGVAVDGSELVIQTSGGAPRFSAIGGTKTRLVVQLEHAGIKPAVGRVFPVGANGIKQVRAVLYKNRPMTTRLAIDTDGSVRLTAYAGADGRLRIRTTALGAKPVAAPAAAKPVIKPLAAQPTKPAAVAAQPKATPTPMAVPAAKKPLAKPNKPVPAPKASSFPESATNLGDGPHLQRSLSSSYAFPIERERVTGRSNPFKVLPNKAKPKPVTDVPGRLPGAPQPIGQVPSLPMPGMGAVNTPPAVPKAPTAPAKTYAVTAVIMGGGQPPVAAIKVDGKTHLVGLNDTLPGNARVKSIHADHVVLTSFNQDIRVGLKK